MAREALVLLFFLALAALYTRPLAASPRDRTLAGGDPLVDLWTVHWLVNHFGEPARMFHGNLFHPARHAVVYSDLSLGTAVLLLPLHGLDPVPLYNLAVLAALGFAGWSWHALAMRLTRNRGAALMAGVLAGFGSHQLSHVYHLNLLGTGWLALLLLGLHCVVEGRGWGGVALAGGAFALAAQSSGYYAVAALLLALVFAVFQRRAIREQAAVSRLAASAALAALLTAPYLAAYLAAHSEQPLRRPLEMSPWQSFLPQRDLTSRAYAYGALLGRGGERLFPGVLPLALAGLAIARRRRESAFYAVAGLLLVVIALGPDLHVAGLTIPLPFRFLHGLPLLGGMRHPYTFAAVATFLLATLAALGFDSLRGSRRPWAGAAAVLLALAETLGPPVATQSLPRGLPPYFAVLDRLPPGPYLELPVYSEHTLVWAARDPRPTLNGQGSAFVPLETFRLARVVENHWVRRTPADVDASRPTRLLLERTPVRYVVVPSGRNPQFRPLAEAFERSRVFALVGEAADGDRVYAVRRDVALPDPGQGGEEPGEVAGQQREAVGDQQ